MSLRNTLRKAASLLVEMPEEEETEARAEEVALPPPGTTTDLWAELEKAAQSPGSAPAPTPTKTVEQIVREGAGPNLDQIKVTPESLPDTTAPNGDFNFQAIYESASLPQVPYTAEQILEMLSGLPADLPIDVRRQMVKAALNSMGKAIGATPETIVADASRKLAALAAYTEHMAQLAAEYTGVAEKKIAALQAEIEETRRGMAATQQKVTSETERCTTESHRLDDVLEFFSLDVPPSKYATNESKPQA